MRFYRIFIGRDRRIGGRQFEQRHGRCSQRQARIAFRQWCRNAQIAGGRDHLGATDVAQQAHRCDIARLRKRFFQRQAFRIAPAGILGAITAFGDLRIRDPVLRAPPCPQRGKIDEQLEGRSWLALGLRGAIEGRFRVILAPDHCYDLAIATHRDERHLCPAQWSILGHPPGDVLQPAVQRGGQRLAGIALLGQLARFRQRPVGEICARGQFVARAHVQRRRPHLPRLGFGNVSCIDHGLDHDPHALLRPRIMLRRGIGARRLQQAGQHRGLIGFQVLRPAVEIMQARCAQAIHIVPEIGVGQIAAEDFVLRQPAFQPECNQRLARLARQRALRRKKGEFGELLSDRAATARPGERGARDPARVHAPVRIEPPVLCRQEGLDHMRWKLRHFDRLIRDCTVAGDRRPVCCQQRDLRRGNRLERFGQRRGNRQPCDQQYEQADDGGKDVAGPPALAAAKPVIALPPPPAPLLLGIEGIVDPIQPIVPVVVIESVMRRVISAMRRVVRLRSGSAQKGIENAHRLLC